MQLPRVNLAQVQTKNKHRRAEVGVVKEEWLGAEDSPWIKDLCWRTQKVFTNTKSSQQNSDTKKASDPNEILPETDMRRKNGKSVKEKMQEEGFGRDKTKESSTGNPDRQDTQIEIGTITMIATEAVISSHTLIATDATVHRNPTTTEVTRTIEMTADAEATTETRDLSSPNESNL